MINKLFISFICFSSLLFSEVVPVNFLTIQNLSFESRIQDSSRVNKFNLLETKNNLTEALSYLIKNLDNPQIIRKPIISGWKEVYIGDIALVTLCHLFSDSTLQSSSVPGYTFQQFLSLNNQQTHHNELLLRAYIKKYGRKKIKLRWQKFWERFINQFYWDNKQNRIAIKSIEGSFPLLQKGSYYVNTSKNFRVLGYEEVASRFWVTLDDLPEKQIADVVGITRIIQNKFKVSHKLSSKEWKITYVKYDFNGGYGFAKNHELWAEYHHKPWLEENRIVFYPKIPSKTYWTVAP